MVSILLAPELYKQIHQPFGCIRLFLKNVRAKAENKSYRGKGGFSLRQLRVGSTLDDASVEVLAGLSGGETIALDPVRAGLVRRKP